MSSERLSFSARLGLALKVLFDASFAARAAAGAGAASALPEPESAPAVAPEPAAAPTPVAASADDGAVHLLAILQREGRLVDFLQEDVASFADAEVGAAARVVHEGCRKALGQHFTLSPLRSEEEGARITVEPGFDPATVRLTGNVSGAPPFQGSLAHPGWRADEVKLPQRSDSGDHRVVAPAEVEL